jgi:hypothetical protein
MKQQNAHQNLLAIRKVSLFLMLQVFVLACAPKVRTSSDYDRSANFSSYRTFSFSNQTTIGIVNPLNAERIVNSIRMEMTKKGFTESDNKADITIHAVTVIKNQHKVHISSSSYGHGGLYRPYGFWGVSGTGHATIRKDDYKVGTLIIDVVDSKTEKLIWTGTADAEINKTPKNPDETIHAAVAKVLAAFPSCAIDAQHKAGTHNGSMNNRAIKS